MGGDMSPLQRTVAAGAALVMVVAACGDVGDPDLGVAPTLGPGTTAQVEAPVPEVAGLEAPADTPFAAQRTPTRPDDFVPEVLVVDADGVRLLGGAVLVQEVDADRAVDDPTGGLVVEVALDEGRQIVWYPAASEAGQVVSEGDDRLMDVAFLDGSVHAVVADDERVALLRLGEPEEQVLLELEPATQVVSLSTAAGLYATVVQDEACGALELRRPDGTPIGAGVVAAPVCTTPGRPAYGLVAFSPDGDSFAYTERTFRSDGVIATTELVVRDLPGAERYRGAVGTEDQAVRSLALDRDLVVLLRDGPEAPEIVRIDLGRPSEVGVTPVDGARSATFTRVPSPER
jgi:hypothetical protein